MRLNKHLIIGRKQQYEKATARLTTNKPALESYEIAIRLNFDIPDSLFDKPLLQANVVIPKNSVSAPTITADVTDNIAETVSKELGVDLNITLLQEENND